MRRSGVESLLRPVDVLLIVPPFALHDRPALGPHILQAVARRAGFETQVLYTNILFAARFGEETHTAIAQMQFRLFLGERLFARSAYGVPALGRDGGAGLQRRIQAVHQLNPQLFDLSVLRRLESGVQDWIGSFAPQVARAGYQVVGCGSSFEQNAASIAILSDIKKSRPQTITIMGGANCEGEMARGVCSLSNEVDHVFSGESEQTFPEFLWALRRGRRPAERVIQGAPCTTLDELPTPDYSDYYEQLRELLPDSEHVLNDTVTLAYETSRGCWWGAKSHCTFCGLNGQGMVPREKSPGRVLDELKALLAEHPNTSVFMTDNIMPHSYFNSLLGRLEREVPDVRIMYEQKANLTLQKVQKLVSAGVREVQPGIEALSTGLLKLMAKGTSAAQNIALLRYASATGMRVHWNLLVGFPRDETKFYEETLELLPLIRHLQYPTVCPVVFDRFSPYFDDPQRHGISELQPAAFYGEVLPESADVGAVAYHFDGTFESAIVHRLDILERVVDEVAAWRLRSQSGAPAELRVERTAAASFALIDTRGLSGLPERQVIDERHACAALAARPVRGAPEGDYRWALDHKVVVERDGRFIPLAVADASLIGEMETRSRNLRRDGNERGERTGERTDRPTHPRTGSS